MHLEYSCDEKINIPKNIILWEEWAYYKCHCCIVRMNWTSAQLLQAIITLVSMTCTELTFMYGNDSSIYRSMLKGAV